MNATANIRDVTLRAIRRGTNSGDPLQYLAGENLTFRLEYWQGCDMPYLARRVGAQTARRFSRLCDLRAHLENPG